MLADRTAGVTDRWEATVVQLTTLLIVERMIAQEIAQGIDRNLPYKEIYQACRARLVSFHRSLPAGGVTP